MFCKLSGVECASVGKGDPCPLRLPQPCDECELQCDEDWSEEDERPLCEKERAYWLSDHFDPDKD